MLLIDVLESELAGPQILFLQLHRHPPTAELLGDHAKYVRSGERVASSYPLAPPSSGRKFVRLLRLDFRVHRIELEWNTSAEVVLEALARAGELTQRMFKGILAEAACKVEVINKLTGWEDMTPSGMYPFDFLVQRGGVNLR